MTSRAHVGPPQPPLSDGVVTLRAPVDGDLVRIHEDGQDPYTQRWVNVPQPYTVEAARAELEQIIGWWDDPAAPFPLSIAAAVDGLYLGMVILFAERPSGIVELGYGVHPSARGRGVGRRAVSLATAWAFDVLGAARVEARTDPENLASQRLLEKAGFTAEGVERSSREVNGRRHDMRCWARLPGDPDPAAATS
ncbi:MAG TPA: GNAT family protein [Gaiellales bacterium]|jgi:RimJ/RimL family protein N-acetyltransferase|nr:GNAT family protein [Gaiellales bacterium]